METYLAANYLRTRTTHGVSQHVTSSGARALVRIRRSVRPQMADGYRTNLRALEGGEAVLVDRYKLSVLKLYVGRTVSPGHLRDWPVDIHLACRGWLL